MTDATLAVELLDQSLALAPNLPAATSAHAIASVRAWWGHATDDVAMREEQARQSVTRAIERAPDLAETHLARAMLAVQVGSLHDATRALSRALELAPTMAEAHQYLGELQVEGGRTAEGQERLGLAIELDASLSIAHISLARVARLTGDRDAFVHHRDALADLFPSPTLPVLNSRFRWAMYDGDRERQDAAYRGIEALGAGPPQRMAKLFAPAIGRGGLDDVLQTLATVDDWAANVRFSSYMYQASAEVLAAMGEDEACLNTLDLAAQRGCIDLLWFQRCPLFDSLRARPRFAEAQRRVQQRATEMWRK